MSDDEDYMSDKFLQACEKHEKTSLIYKHSDKREFALLKMKANSKKSNKLIEAEKREEGLSSAITSANKGFGMLMKMGYKPGQGIGKSQSGITEPIPVEVKADRQGLGKTLKKSLYKNTDAKLNNMNTTDFRNRLAREKTERVQRGDLRKSQKVCQELDIKKNVEKPNESWFWPENKEDETVNDTTADEGDTNVNETDTDDEQFLDDIEKLNILTKYLRTRYFYCIWCGTRFNDEDDLRDSCPGNTRDDH